MTDWSASDINILEIAKGNHSSYGDYGASMKSQIDPPIIVVYGNMIPGMTGTFLNIKYCDAFDKKAQQLRMDIIPNLFTIKEAI